MAVQATISVVSTTAYSATLKITIGSGYDTYRVFVRPGRASDTGSAVYDEEFRRTTTFRVTVDGLSPETTYSCNVCSMNDEEAVWYHAVEFTTQSARPSEWYWWSSIRTGAVLAQASADGKMLSVISREEWIAFCENINEVRSYMGYSHYYFTVPVRGTTKLDAAIVNEARAAINDMGPPVAVPTAAKTGSTPMSAAFFNGLKNALNSIY